MLPLPLLRTGHDSFPSSGSGRIRTHSSAFFQYIFPPGKLIQHCIRGLLMPLWVAQLARCIEEFPSPRKTDRITNSNRIADRVKLNRQFVPCSPFPKSLAVAEWQLRPCASTRSVGSSGPSVPARDIAAIRGRYFAASHFWSLLSVSVSLSTRLQRSWPSFRKTKPQRARTGPGSPAGGPPGLMSELPSLSV